MKVAQWRAGITPNRHEAWVKQITKNITMDEWDFLEGRRYLNHDRDAKFTDSFRTMIKSSQKEPHKFPARSPNLNAYVGCWVRSVKKKALSELILLGEASLSVFYPSKLSNFGRKPAWLLTF